MPAHAGKQAVVPGERVRGTVHPEEHRLVFRKADELAQLGARQLEEARRLCPRAGLALQPGERGKKRGWNRAGIDLDFHRDRVSGGGGGEIGREQDPEHGVRMSWADEHGMWRGRPAHEIAENPAAPAASTSGPGVPMRGIFAGNIKGLLMMAVHHRHTEAWSGGAATKLNLGSLLPKKAQELVTRCITQTIADPRPSKTVSLSIGMTLLFRGFSCLLVAECICRLTVARVAWASCPCLEFGQFGHGDLPMLPGARPRARCPCLEFGQFGMPQAAAWVAL